MDYKELKKWGLKHYNQGGDIFVECWDQSVIKMYEEELGRPMTWDDVYRLASCYDSIEREQDAMSSL